MGMQEFGTYRSDVPTVPLHPGAARNYKERSIFNNTLFEILY
jgi:TRAP-type uncharacterized transport system substrate-binding protein